MKYMEEDRVLECYRRHKDTVYKLAYSYFRCKSQAEDAFQEVFYKFMVHCPVFQDLEHEKAWFIRTTINVCKDLLKTKWNCDMLGLEDWDSEDKAAMESSDILDELQDAILALPERYRVPIHLYYYEEYSVREIARMLHRTESAVQTQLQRGRERIKQTMEGSGTYEIKSRYLRRSNGEC